MHDKKMRSLRRHRFRRFFLLLAAALGVVPAWSFAASVVLASGSMLTLAGAQHTVTLNVDAAHGAALRQIAQGRPASLPGDPASYRSALLVLDDVELTAVGARGGYFYKIYLTPAGDARASEQQLAGTLGPFEIAAARKRGAASMSYSLGGALGSFGDGPVSPLAVTFQRAGGTGGGAGADAALIGIGSFRVELSTEAGN
jgi:tyrosinase